MQLIYPTIQYKDSYLHAIEEADKDTNPFLTTIAGPKHNQSFEEFLKEKIDQANGMHLPEGWVPATELWLVDNEEFIGTVNIRHFLTEHLLRIGGHIGYWIRPTKRRIGYGKKILQLALAEAKRLGISKVLVTCDDTNIASAKIIEANGGVLENAVEVGEGHPKKRRYWISLS